jgi:hypothetical protein
VCAAGVISDTIRRPSQQLLVQTSG